MLRYVWIAAIVGFPVALILGWRYDVVDGQIVHTETSVGNEDPRLRHTDYLLMSALVLVIGGSIYGLGSEFATDRLAPATSKTSTVIHPKSIVVLPFDDLSKGDESAGLLAGGIQDDLLTRLSKVAALKVLSRTTAERYRDTTKTIPEIGRELGVANVLEGAVQRMGNQLRVNVQLIDAALDEHVWAETYDLDLSAASLFANQSRIVETIADQLKATLTQSESTQVTMLPTDNLDAYSAYLRGVQQAETESVESMHSAVEHFKQAINLDPEFSLAHIGLADAYLTLGANFAGAMAVDESNALAEPPLLRAMQLDDTSGEAYASLGLLRKQQGNWQAAAEAYDRAMELRPNYARVYRLYGQMRWQQGNSEQAIAFAQKALSIDPYSAPANFDLARYYDVMGRFDEALPRYMRIVEVKPRHAFAYVYIAAMHYLVYGNVDESLIWYHRAAANDALSPSLQAVPAIAYLELGDVEAARAWVESGMELGAKTFWSLWTSVLLNLYESDIGKAKENARLLLDIYPRYDGALHVLRNADIADGRYEIARERYARSHEELFVPEEPIINQENFSAAVDLALVLLRLGEQEHAHQLLDSSLEFIQTLPRHGTNGYWIADVRILAIREDRDLAIEHLRQAVDEGWRVLVWYYLDLDPSLESIRGEPDFKKIRERVQLDLNAQATHVQELLASGDL